MHASSQTVLPCVSAATGHRATTHLKYLQGSPFVSTDLARADITHALAVFVVCNKYARDPEQEDTNTTMTVLAISQYLRQNVDVSKQGHVFRGVLSGTSEVQGWGSVRWKDEASRVSVVAAAVAMAVAVAGGSVLPRGGKRAGRATALLHHLLHCIPACVHKPVLMTANMRVRFCPRRAPACFFNHM